MPLATILSLLLPEIPTIVQALLHLVSVKGDPAKSQPAIDLLSPIVQKISAATPAQPVVAGAASPASPAPVTIGASALSAQFGEYIITVQKAS